MVRLVLGRLRVADLGFLSSLESLLQNMVEGKEEVNSLSLFSAKVLRLRLRLRPKKVRCC